MTQSPAAGWRKKTGPARVSDHLPGPSPGHLEQPGEKPSEAARTVCSPQTIGLGAGNGVPMALRRTSRAISAKRPEARSSSIRKLLRTGGDTRLPGASSRHGVGQAERFRGGNPSEVFPDGSATRVTYGMLNLTHRDGHEGSGRSSRASDTGAVRLTNAAANLLWRPVAARNFHGLWPSSGRRPSW